MTHHAKAPSAGSTQATGDSRSLIRRASVTSFVSTQHIATPEAGESGPDSTAPTTPSRAAVTADTPAFFSVSAPHITGSTRTTAPLLAISLLALFASAAPAPSAA